MYNIVKNTDFNIINLYPNQKYDNLFKTYIDQQEILNLLMDLINQL